MDLYKLVRGGHIQKLFSITAAIIIVSGMAASAHAFRPFLSEDASVLTPKDFEIEFGILDISHQSGDLISGHTLQFEAGVVKNWELILRGELQTIYKDSEIKWDNSILNMASTDLLLKVLLREEDFHSNSDWAPNIALMAGALFLQLVGTKRSGFKAPQSLLANRQK